MGSGSLMYISVLVVKFTLSLICSVRLLLILLKIIEFGPSTHSRNIARGYPSSYSSR